MYKRQALFSQPDGVEQGDLIGRTAELDAAAAAAHRLDQAVLDQRLDQLEQEQFRDRVGPGDVGDPAQAGPIDRTIAQRGELRGNGPDRCSSPQPEECRRRVSKDASGGSGTIWSLLRDTAVRLLRMRAAKG